MIRLPTLSRWAAGALVFAALALPLISVSVSFDAHGQAAPPPAKKATTKKTAAPAAKKTTKKGATAAAPAPSANQPTSSEAWTAPPAQSISPYVPPPVRKVVPPAPRPTPEQVKALSELAGEAVDYEKAARDYRDAITRIVQHHYEDKRRRMLASLDSEIDTEKKNLREAREEAIKRLEDFVARYSGPKSNPDNTPDAMFRLAALYEERARTESPDDVTEGLRPAVALYKRIIREFPSYRELAGIYYYLGHALNDSSRLDEAQQVWRSLVCHNKYPYPVAPDPQDADKDTIVRLPQDHEEDYWRGWENAHPTPIGLMGTTKKGGKARVVAGDEELVYTNPYPQSCTPVPQQIEPGKDPRYVAEIWWQLGNWHFDQIDPRGGPYNLNRAETAYRQGMKWKKPPLFGVAMYKLAWTYFKQQRYETAVRQFIELLSYTDEQEKATGDPGTDFRAEAYTYIAGSLTYLDFAGPGDAEPFIARNDVLDTETNPTKAEQKMHVAVDRVQDPKLLPQDKKWTVEIYKGLVQEFREINQWHNAIEVSELILKKWPMNRDAPNVQNDIAKVYEDLAKMSRDGTPEREQNSARALEARTKLIAYVGNTPWVDANRDDPEAIQAAERLVKGGLQRAAADHTNLARAFVAKATETRDPNEQKPWLEKALSEYRLADVGWTGFLRQDENAPDAYETKFWIADARHGIVVVTVNLDRSPSPQETNAAREAAADVRDSNEDDKYLQPAAYYVVDVTEQALQDQYRLFKRTGGAQGIEERAEVHFEKSADGIDKVVLDPIPVSVQSAMRARDEYVTRVPPASDTPKNAIVYQFQVADFQFLYGHFAEARQRFEPIWKEHCGKDEYGYKAWEKLVTMAARSNDVEGSRALASVEEKQSCAVSEEQKIAEKGLIEPVKIGGAYIDAARLFKEAEAMKDGPERQQKWRDAAAQYYVALTQEGGASRDEAPEAAINGAYAYKQVGEYDRAIKMYELFITNYGSEKTLAKLEQDKSPKYPERVKYLKQAYDTLSKSYVLFFNYRAAAETYDKISSIQHFEEKDRREAAKNALTLYASMGDQNKMAQVRARAVGLHPSAQEKAEADFIVADSDMKSWDPLGTDDGVNKTARVKATTAMTQFHDANKNVQAAAKFVVQAAYNVMRMRAASEANADDWRKKTIQAFERYKASTPTKDGKNDATSSPEAGMAAECAYAMLDQEIKKKFDYDSGLHRYAGSSVDVIKKYRADAAVAIGYQDRLKKEIIDAYVSPEWVTAAVSRQGSLFDSLRTGLFNTRPPALKLVDDKTDKLLKRFEQSDNPDDQDKADQIRQRFTEAWRSARELELDSADKAMVSLYAKSLALSKRFKVRPAAVNKANSRLAFFTDILGEEKMAQYAQGTEGLDYRPGVFLQTRPGLVVTPPTQPLLPPPIGAP